MLAAQTSPASGQGKIGSVGRAISSGFPRAWLELFLANDRGRDFIYESLVVVGHPAGGSPNPLAGKRAHNVRHGFDLQG
jgi:hypothetical protein